MCLNSLFKDFKMPKYWVSVTGLELKSWFHYPQFAMHAVPSYMQAEASPGNVYTYATSIGIVQHTLTVWESRQDMLNYLRQGEHLKAMKIARAVGKYGKIYGGESDSIPSWAEALELWAKKGRVSFGQPKEGDLVGHHKVMDPPTTEEMKSISSKVMDPPNTEEVQSVSPKVAPTQPYGLYSVLVGVTFWALWSFA